MRKVGGKIIGMVLCSLLALTNTMKAEGKETMQPSEKNYCSISDFEDFHYYLFCNTNIEEGTIFDNPMVNIFIGSDAETAEKGEELYRQFMEPFRETEHEGYMELFTLSPDGRLALTVENGRMICRVFDGEKEIEQRAMNPIDGEPVLLIEKGDSYIAADKGTIDQKTERMDEEKGYRTLELNEQGNIAVGEKHDRLHDAWELAVYDLESTEVLWTIYQGKEYDYAYQIQGNKESGRVVFQLGNRDFYAYEYPSGETRYLGKDIYYPRFSPDGKYLAYSSPDIEACFDLNQEEAEEVMKILPGIYILEVETGRTAYIRQDVYDPKLGNRLVTRVFHWVEKDCFEQIMEERKPEEGC